MSVLSQTPGDKLLDPQGRPYFLWDTDMDLESFRRRLQDEDPDVRAYFVGKLMRQAKPDDVFFFVRLADVVALWPRVRRHLGLTTEFWTWVLHRWEVLPGEPR